MNTELEVFLMDILRHISGKAALKAAMEERNTERETISKNIRLSDDWLSCGKVAANVRKHHKKGSIGRTLFADWMVEVWEPTGQGDILEETAKWLEKDPARLNWAKGLGLVRVKEKHDWSGLQLARFGVRALYDAHSKKYLIYFDDNNRIWRNTNAAGGAGKFDKEGRLILSPMIKEAGQDDIDWSELELKHYDNGGASLFDKKSGNHLLDFCTNGTVYLNIYTKSIL